MAEATWTEAADFFYNDRPRVLRVWDEAFQPGLTITLSVQDIFLTLGRIRSNAYQTEMLQIVDMIRNSRDQRFIIIPEFQYELDKTTIKASLTPNARSELDQILDMLWYLSGKLVRLRDDGQYGKTLVEYRITFPPDFYPVLVLDASARVNEFYNLYGNAQGMVHRLPEATKRYDNVTIRLEEGGSGKEWLGRGDNAQEHLHRIADIIRKHPSMKPLLFLSGFEGLT